MKSSIINNKTVFVVEKHHEVLPAWIQASLHRGKALPLITFDYHTDLIQCFYGLTEAKRQARINRINIRDPNSVNEAVDDLKYDQHIDCAHQLGVVSDVYVFLSYSKQNLHQSYATLFNIEPCAPSCPEQIHYDCETKKANVVIDDSVIEPKVMMIEKNLALETCDYILDIDLDVFNTVKAISPPQSKVFQRLIRHSAIITIARESTCVSECRLDEEVTADYLQDMLFRHIDAV